MTYSMQTKQGNALISALFIMTLIAITATAMMSRLSSDIHQTERFIHADTRYLAAQVVSFWAMDQLQASTLPPFTTLKSKGLAILFPENMQTIYPGHTVQGELYDLQSRFNLNNLIQSDAKNQCLRLIQSRKLNLNPSLITLVISATQDWISPNINASGQDKWSGYYASLKPPYQASHQLLQNPSEFRLIAGVTPALYNALAPFITALPETTPININTAPPPVLRTLSPGLTEAQAHELVSLRGEEGFQNTEALRPIIEQFHLKAAEFTLESHYFMSVAHVTDGKQGLTVYTIFKRTQDEMKRFKVNVLQVSLNTI